MSCFIMDLDALAVLANGMEKVLNMGYDVYSIEAPEALREALKDCADRYGCFDEGKIFHALYTLNYTAYHERYNCAPDAPEVPEIPSVHSIFDRLEYSDGHRILNSNYYQYTKLLECLIYQCTEGEVTETPLYKGLKAFELVLMRFLVQNNDEWQRFRWSELESAVNPMCKDCQTRKQGTCKGTTEKVWTGCVLRKV